VFIGLFDDDTCNLSTLTTIIHKSAKPFVRLDLKRFNIVGHLQRDSTPQPLILGKSYKKESSKNFN
jgi:hypothetical protein